MKLNLLEVDDLSKKNLRAGKSYIYICKSSIRWKGRINYKGFEDYIQFNDTTLYVIFIMFKQPSYNGADRIQADV